MKNFKEINRTFTVKKTNQFFKRVIGMIMLILATVLTTNAWGADETLTLAQGTITAGYTTNTGSQNTSASNSIGLSWTQCLYSAGFQLQASGGEIHSTSYPSTNCVIKSVTLTVSTNTANLMGSYNGTSWYTVAFESGTAVNVENMGFRYFKITSTGSYCKFSALSVVYTTPTYYTITYNDKDGEHTVSALKGRTLAEVLSEEYSGADPTSCNTTDYPYFYGWKSSAISGTTSTPPTVLKAEKVTGAATYYAVWTDEPLEWAAASSISEGDKVVFCYVNGNTKKEMTSLNGKIFDVSDFETGESVPTGTYNFLVETGNGGTGFSFLHDGAYISYVGDKDVTMSPIKDNASSWNVSITSYDASINNVSADSYYFKYNTNSPRLTSYMESAGNTAWPQIYKKQQSGTPVYLTECCATNIVLETPNITGEGTITFSPSGMAPTCDDDAEVTMTITPASGYYLSALGNATGSGKVSPTNSPSIATSGSASEAVQNISLIFAENADGAYSVNATFTAKDVTDWTWKQENPGPEEIAIPATVNLYVGQQAWFNLKGYTPSDVINEKKGYSAAYSSTYLAQDGKGNTQYKTRAKEVISSTTLTFTSTSNGSVTQVITISISALPSVTFIDLIHGESFSAVSANVDGTDKRIVHTTKPTPTHSDVADPGEGYNACERNHLHLVGWIDKAWVDDGHQQATHSEISSAGAGNFYAPGADMDLAAKNGKTFYAVWAKEGE